MKSNYAKNVGGRLLTLLAILLFALYSGTASAQSGNLILTQGNVNIYQNADGWVIYHGNAVIAHGEGTLDITDLPPAFQDFLDYYAALSLDKSPKKSLSKEASPTYGPLLRTQWNQTAPWNDMCPSISVRIVDEDGNFLRNEEQQTVIGCVSITSGYILNYYRYCKPIKKSDEFTYGHYFTVIPNADVFNFKNKSGNTYSYDIDYTPNFDLINNSNEEVAKFLMCIAILQHAQFDVTSAGGTSTFVSNQLTAFNEFYGYTADRYSISNLTDEQYIENSIKKGWPVIIDGSDDDGGHSFMVTGFNGSEFFIDYGWGGKGNGWFTKTTYPTDQGIIILHPQIDNFVGMQASPQTLYIRKPGEDYKTFDMVQSGNVLEYRQEEDLTLSAGEYEFYFEYSDGTEIAPYTDGKTIALTDEYSRLGCFVTTPAKFKISSEHKVNFWHLQNKGEIKIECADYNVALSGQVLDEQSKGVAGVTISTSKEITEATVDQSNVDDGCNSGYGMKEKDRWYTNSFVPTNSCLTEVDVKVFKPKNHNPTTDIHVAVMDNSQNVLWQTTLPNSAITSGDWMSVPIDGNLYVTPGQKYFVALSVDVSDESNYWCYYYDGTNKQIQFKVLTTSTFYTTTDVYGKYSMKVEKGFSGQIFAQHSDYLLGDPLTVTNATKSIDNLNFTALTKTITVSGKVLDASGNGIGSAIIAESKPSVSVGSENSTNGVGGLSSYNYTMYKSAAFKFADAAYNYITDVEVYVKKNQAPSDLIVSVLDANGKVLTQKQVAANSISTSSYQWVKVSLEDQVKIVSGSNYYVGLSVVGENNNTNFYYYYVNGSQESGYKMYYKVYTTETPFAKSTSTGAYQYEVERYSSFTLNAFTEDNKNFNSLTFSKLSANATNKDFKENGATVSYYGPLTVTEENGVKTAVIDGTSEEELNITSAIENVDVTYNRSFTTGICATIMLPFDFDASVFKDKGTFRTIDYVQYNSTTKEWIANLSEPVTGTIEANKPYIFEPSANITSVNFGKVEIKATSIQSNEANKWELVGVYKPKVWTEKSTNEFGFAAEELAGAKVGDFVRVGKGASIAPLRCYLRFNGDVNSLISKSTTNLPERITVVIPEVEEEQPIVVEEQVELPEIDDFATPVSELVSNKDVKVWSFDKTIFIESAAGQDYIIVDANGRMLRNSVTTSNRDEVVLNRQSTGIVIVRIANKSFKLKY